MRKGLVFLMLFVFVSVSFAVSVGYRIHAGWNNMSVPGTVERVHYISDVFPIITGAVYVYDPVSRSYETMTGFPAPNVGFWALFEVDTTITIECTCVDVPIPCPTLRITSMVADPTEVFTGEETNVSARVFYDGIAPTSINFTADGGTVGEPSMSMLSDGFGVNVGWTAPDAPGTYTVTLEVTDGCATATDDVEIRVNVIPRLDITRMTATPNPVNIGEISNINAVVTYTGTGTVEYTWSSDAGTIEEGSGPMAMFTAPMVAGAVNVTLHATDGTLSDDFVLPVNVEEPLPTIDITGITMTPDPATPLGVAALHADVTYSGAGVLTYTWSVDGGTIDGTTADANWNTPDFGTYNVTLIVSDGAVSDTLAVPFNVE